MKKVRVITASLHVSSYLWHFYIHFTAADSSAETKEEQTEQISQQESSKLEKGNNNCL